MDNSVLRYPVAAVVAALLAARVDHGALSYLARGAFDARSLAAVFANSLAPMAVVGFFLLCLSGLGGLAAGVGLLATALTWLGWLGLLKTGPVLFVAAVFALVGLVRAYGNVWQLSPGRVAIQSPWQAALLGVIGYCVFHALIVALAPQTGWDVLAYHLALPKLYLKSGAVAAQPTIWFSRMPHLLEVLYVLPLRFAGENAAALLHLSLACAWLWAVGSVALAEWGPGAAVIAVALLASSRSFITVAGQAHADAALALFHFAGAMALWRGDFGLAGLLLGFGAASKLQGVFLLGIWTAWVAWARREKLWSFAWPAALSAGPWYLKSWLETGNPVWPFGFGGRFDGARVAAQALRETAFHRADLPSLLQPSFGILPFVIPALLAAVWAAWARRKWPPLIKFLFMPVIPYGLVVLGSIGGWRYFWPCYPALALLTAWAAVCVPGRLRWAAAAAVVFGLSCVTVASENNELFAALELRSAREPEKPARRIYLERTLDVYPAMEEVNAKLPGAKVLLFRETRGYHLETGYLWGHPATQGVLRYAELPDAAALRDRLKELGVTHVLVNEGLEHFMPQDGIYDARTIGLMDEVLRASASPVVSRGAVTVHALR